MKNNPFISQSFTKIWLKHFNAGQEAYSFNFIKGLSFLKQKLLPIYTNVGKNNTNGISYSLNDISQHKDYKKNVFIIYDVPTYFNIAEENKNSRLKTKRINQYKGVLIDISAYESFDDLLQNKFKAKSRYNLRKKQKQLENNFNITYCIYDDKITTEEYNFLAKHLKEQITKRFDGLKKHNRVVNTWDYYYDLMLPLIKEKKAVIITVNRDNIPIGMTFNLLSEKVLFYAITTFDTDFINYNIGHTTIMQILKWCFENNYDIVDFSKGETEYKNRWLSSCYHFQNHILYDSKSISATLFANAISIYFQFKQFLRNQNINMFYTRLKFLFKKNSTQNSKKTALKLTCVNIIEYAINEFANLGGDVLNNYTAYF